MPDHLRGAVPLASLERPVIEWLRQQRARTVALAKQEPLTADEWLAFAVAFLTGFAVTLLLALVVRT